MRDAIKGLVAAPQSSQFRRDVALVALLVVVVAAYLRVLSEYLHGLDRPLIVEIGFVASFAIACTYEFKAGVRWRVALIGCLSTGLVFLGGAWLAQWFRGEYVELVELMKDDVAFAEWVGKDLHAAFTARMVGYGGCFAVGLLVLRMTVGRNSVRGLLQRTFLLSSNLTCPCCGKPIDQ